MKIRPEHLEQRIGQVAAELRGVQRINRTKVDAPTPEVDRAVTTAAQAIASEIVQRQAQYRDTDFGFDLLHQMRRAVDGWPEAQQKAVFDYGDGGLFQDKIEPAVRKALADKGLGAASIGFERDYGHLHMTVSGVKTGAKAIDPTASAAVTGRPQRAVSLDAKTGAAMMGATIQRLDEAIAHVSAFAQRGPIDPKAVQAATVALEKAARQLETQVSAQGQGADAGELQRTYVRLLGALSQVDLPRSASIADGMDASGPGGPIAWMMSGLGKAKSKLTGEATGQYERRVQQALVTLYENAPLFSGSTPKLPSTAFVRSSFGLASPEILADPSKAAVLLQAAGAAEVAANAELAGDAQRAKHAYQEVASSLFHALGPELVTAEAALKLGDFWAAQGRDDKASRVYVGALRILEQHLPDDHALVRSTAEKLSETGGRWLASLDGDKSKPMSSDARFAASIAADVRKELRLDAILSSTAPVVEQLDRANDAAWASGLHRAASATPTQGAVAATDSDREAFRKFHYAVYGPMSL